MKPPFVLFFFALLTWHSKAQTTDQVFATVDSLISNSQYQLAANTLEKSVKDYELKGLIDSLGEFPYYLGLVEIKKGNSDQALNNSKSFFQSLQAKTNNSRTLFTASLSLMKVYDDLGKTKQSFNANLEALNYAEKTSDISPTELADIHRNLCVNRYRAGEIDVSRKYIRQAVQLYESDPSINYVRLSGGYNVMGALCSVASKLDSAALYYQKAVEALNKTEGDAYEKLADAAVIKSNIALLKSSTGNLQEAITTQESIIKDYQTVIANSKDVELVKRIKEHSVTGISNLAVYFDRYGDAIKARQLSKLGYEVAQKYFAPGNPAIYKSLITLAQSELILAELEAADQHYNAALELMNQGEEEDYFRLGDLYYGKGQIQEERFNLKKAEEYFLKADFYFDKSLNGSYNAKALNYLIYRALFWADNGEGEKAVALATKGYDFVLENAGDDNHFMNQHILCLAEVNYEIGDYPQTIKWAEQGISFLDKQSVGKTNELDVMRLEYLKPNLIVSKLKATYNLQPTRDEAFLLKILDELKESERILNFRKSFIIDSENTAILLKHFIQTYQLSEKINLELYRQTNQEKYLNAVLAIHESTLYNKIRSRLNAQKDINYSGVPKEIVAEEIRLKRAMSTALESETNEEELQNFFSAKSEWNAFHSNLRESHPDYFNLRYGTTDEDFDLNQKQLPNETSVLRYLFIDQNLYALIWTNEGKEIIKLVSNNESERPDLMVGNLINELNENLTKLSDISKLSSRLYALLWEPISDKINSKKVIIIPDGSLFNLSFELLTQSATSSNEEFVKSSLLNQKELSYNFSLHLVNNETNRSNYNNKMAAFAPGFSQNLKDQYKTAVKDSINWDMGYLKTISQPFSIQMLKNLAKQYQVNGYKENDATLQSFISEANGHNIIHIGTHAESNNLNPNFSKLIFAKQGEDQPNELYAYNIYEQSFRSKLTVLTACETGKPTLQAGEGMISLAHAFNYAGSESMLTSLWKIDEESTMQIAEYFYQHLAEGMDKVKALQKAKLEFIKKAPAAYKAPTYWAGLVLIGDTQPVPLGKKRSKLPWILLGLGLLGLLFWKWKKE